MRTVLIVAAVFLAGAGGALWINFGRDITLLRARLAGRSLTLPTQFGTMEYAEQGRAQPVLVIHGSGGGFDQGI